MKKIFVLLALFSASSQASICENHPILRDFGYSPEIGYAGAILAACGLIMFLNAFFRKNQITAFNQFSKIMLAVALIAVPGYGYYDLKENYGFENKDFFEFSGSLNTCFKVKKAFKEFIE